MSAAPRASSCARSIAARGRSSPNITTSGLRMLPQRRAGRRRPRRRAAGRRRRAARAYGTEAAGRANRAVHLDHRPRARPLVEQVDVLGDDGAHPAVALEPCQRDVRSVRLGVREHVQAAAVEVPHLRPGLAESVDGRVLHRVVVRPDARGRAEVRDATLGARRLRRSGRRTAAVPGSARRGAPRSRRR